jgi:hypothetical protein
MAQVSGAPRLPTRCPVCKGAVIGRMPHTAHGAFIWFHCHFCNHTWKFRIADARADMNGELTGDVFVATKSGKKHRLGSVRINAIPEDELQGHFESKMLHGELESQKLQREIDALTATLETARTEERRLWKIQKRDESNLQKAKAWSVAYNKTKTLTRQIEELQTQRQHLTSGEYFFQGLPSAISTARTDADGRFTLIIPREGRYGIVACATRTQDKEEETYFWFVWITLDGQPSKRVILSDDNLMGAGSADSALQ